MGAKRVLPLPALQPQETAGLGHTLLEQGGWEWGCRGLSLSLQTTNNPPVHSGVCKVDRPQAPLVSFCELDAAPAAGERVCVSVCWWEACVMALPWAGMHTSTPLSTLGVQLPLWLSGQDLRSMKNSEMFVMCVQHAG